MYSNLALFLDISRTSKFKKQMEKSMPKAQMEKTIDHGPFAFDISTIGKNSF